MTLLTVEKLQSKLDVLPLPEQLLNSLGWQEGETFDSDELIQHLLKFQPKNNRITQTQHDIDQSNSQSVTLADIRKLREKQSDDLLTVKDNDIRQAIVEGRS